MVQCGQADQCGQRFGPCRPASLVVLLVTVFVYRRKVSLRSVLAIIVALLGGVLIMGADYSTFAGGNITGNIFAFFAAVFMGLYFAMGDEVRKRVDGGLYVLMVFASCWICFYHRQYRKRYRTFWVTGQWIMSILSSWPLYAR